MHAVVARVGDGERAGRRRGRQQGRGDGDIPGADHAHVGAVPGADNQLALKPERAAVVRAEHHDAPAVRHEHLFAGREVC